MCVCVCVRVCVCALVFSKDKREWAIFLITMCICHVCREVLAAYTRVLGPDHRNTLTTACNLSGVLDNQGDHASAVVIYQDVLTKQKRVLGKYAYGHVRAQCCS